MFRQDNVSLVEFFKGGNSMFWPWRIHVVSCLVCSPGDLYNIIYILYIYVYIYVNIYVYIVAVTEQKLES